MTEPDRWAAYFAQRGDTPELDRMLDGVEESIQIAIARDLEIGAPKLVIAHELMRVAASLLLELGQITEGVSDEQTWDECWGALYRDVKRRASESEDGPDATGLTRVWRSSSRKRKKAR